MITNPQTIEMINTYIISPANRDFLINHLTDAHIDRIKSSETSSQLIVTLLDNTYKLFTGNYLSEEQMSTFAFLFWMIFSMNRLKEEDD